MTDEALNFFRRAGVATSRDPLTETADQATERIVRELATAEEWLVSRPGFTVEWEADPDYDRNDYDCKGMPEIGWRCVVSVPDGNGGSAHTSLCGIAFDGDGYPGGNDYARVVVAELAGRSEPLRSVTFVPAISR